MRVAERLAGRDANLLAHQIDAGDHLRDGVLDLDARVHFEEEELVAGDETLDGSGGVVGDGFGGAKPRRAHRRAHALRNRRGRLFPQLLVAALQRTVAFADVHDAAVLVGEQLQLDVLRILEITLGVDRPILEVGFGLAARGLERRLQFVQRLRDFQSLAAAAGGGLECERQAVGLRGAARGGDVGHRRDAARHERHAGGLHRLPRAQLVAHRVDRVGVRPDPNETVLHDAPRERGVLGQKAVAGMNRLRRRPARGLDDLAGVEVTQARGRRPM